MFMQNQGVHAIGRPGASHFDGPQETTAIARARFLKTFHGMLPEELNQFYWQNSGGEAVDKRLKLVHRSSLTGEARGRTGTRRDRTL
jgi:adenosylmethionine-8-amino-7-oxononanoate aminotransferase